MENFQFLAKKSWYKQWWGIIIIAVICFLAAFVIAVGLMSWHYQKLIKQGYGEDLKKSIYGERQIDPKIATAREELEKIDRPFLGNPEASLVIVEFVDFKCPVCKEQDPIIRKIINKYGQQTKLIIRNFPIESAHPGASKLAEMAYCAHEQGLYWPAHDYLFTNQEKLTQNLTAEDINSFVGDVGLDGKKFNICLVSDKTKTEIKRDNAVFYKYTISDTSKYTISGTPTFFINGNKLPGNVPLSTWEDIVSSALSS